MKNDSKNVDEYLSKLPEWKATNLEIFRKSIHNVFPEVTEEIKWGVPVFLLNDKMLFVMSAFKEHTKFNFIGNGALLEDKDDLFNNGFDSKKSRGIDLREGERINATQLEDLIKLAGQKLV